MEERQPWKTLLELSARAPWRVTDANVLPSVPQLHRRKHLQQVYQDRVVNVHKNLVKQREAERRRLLRNDPARKSDTPLVMYGREETWASLYFRFQPNWAVVSRVLQEAQALLQRNASWRPRRIIDFGIGCGSASAAALDVFSSSPGETETPIQWIHGIDPSQTMRQCAQEIFQEKFERHNLPPRLTFSSYLSSANVEDSSEVASFDLALCAYGLTELPYGSAALSVITLLWEKLNDNGVLVVIEPGTPDGFATIRMVRNFLLAAAQEDTVDDFHILAPCTHHGSCPLERLPPHSRPNNWKKTQQDVEDDANDEVEEEESEDQEEEDDEEQPEMSRGYCSFVHSLPAQRGKSKSEKFSYLVVQKRSKSNDGSRMETDSSLTQLLKESLKNSQISVEGDFRDAMIACEDLDRRARTLEEQYLSQDDENALGLELVREERQSFSRIIRAPKKKKGHVFIEGCAAPGRIARYKVSKSASIAAPGLYAAARKSRWGGFWPHVSDLEG